MKIQNSQTKVEKGTNLNDKDYMYNLLSSLKEMVKGYSQAITEASNETLVKDYKEALTEYVKLQRETFELMFQNGWYILEAAEDKKIENELNTLEQLFIELNEENSD